MKHYSLLALLILLLSSCGGEKEWKDMDMLEKWSDLNSKWEKLDEVERKERLADVKALADDLNFDIKIKEKEHSKQSPQLYKDKKRKTIPVTVSTVQKKNFSTYVDVTGQIEVDDEMTINSEMAGQVIQFDLNEGSYINKGDFVLAIDDQTVKKNIEALEIQLSEAQIIFNKRSRLWEQNIGSEIEFIRSKNAVESLQKQIETTKISLGKFQQYSPMSGILDKVYINKGEIISPGRPIATVLDLSRVKVTAELAEVYLGKIKIGDRVIVSSPTLNYEFGTRVTHLGQTLNPDSRSFKIEMDIDNTKRKLKPNSLAMIKIRDSYIPDAITIDSKLIQRDLEGYYVYIKGSNDDNEVIAKKVRIETGETFDSETIIEAGLNGGEVLINDGYGSVKAGDLLDIQS